MTDLREVLEEVEVTLATIHAEFVIAISQERDSTASLIAALNAVNGEGFQDPAWYDKSGKNAEENREPDTILNFRAVADNLYDLYHRVGKLNARLSLNANSRRAREGAGVGAREGSTDTSLVGARARGRQLGHQLPPWHEGRVITDGTRAGLEWDVRPDQGGAYSTYWEGINRPAFVRRLELPEIAEDGSDGLGGGRGSVQWPEAGVEGNLSDSGGLGWDEVEPPGVRV